MSRSSTGGTIVAVAAAVAGAAGAAGAVALERAARRRRELAALDPDGGYDQVPDEVMTVLATDGVPLHVEVDRPAEPVNATLPTVVLSHGYTLNLDSWVFQRRALVAAGYRVVLWDQRGHGMSGMSDDEHATIEQLGHDLARVIEAAAPTGDLVLVGHSMGGMTTMSLAHYHPEVIRERVIAVALVSTSAGGSALTDLDFGPIVGQFLGQVGPAVLGRLMPWSAQLLALRPYGRRIEDALVVRYSFDSPVSQNLVRFTGDMILGTPFTTMAQLLTALDDLDEVAALENFRGIETLVLNGRGDLMTPPVTSDHIVHHIPGAEHVVVEDAGHLIMLEHPDLVSRQLRELIDRALRARPADKPAGRPPRLRRVISDLSRRVQVRQAREAAAATS